jgi:hypothetical protein
MTKAKVHRGTVSVESDGATHSGTYETQGNIIRVYGANGGGPKNTMINKSNVEFLANMLLLEIGHERNRRNPAT